MTQQGKRETRWPRLKVRQLVLVSIIEALERGVMYDSSDQDFIDRAWDLQKEIAWQFRKKLERVDAALSGSRT